MRTLASVFRFRLGHQLAYQILLVTQELDTGTAIGNPYDAAFNLEALFGGQQEPQANLGTYRNIVRQIPFQCGATFGKVDHRRGWGMLRDDRMQIDSAAGVMPFIDMGHVCMVPQVPLLRNGNESTAFPYQVPCFDQACIHRRKPSVTKRARMPPRIK